MGKELIINSSLPETRIALIEDGNIQELVIGRSVDSGVVGNIYKGRVTRVLPGMQAAFVDIGLDKAAFLYVDDVYMPPEIFGGGTEDTDEEAEASAASSDTSDESNDEVDDLLADGPIVDEAGDVVEEMTASDDEDAESGSDSDSGSVDAAAAPSTDDATTDEIASEAPSMDAADAPAEEPQEKPDEMGPPPKSDDDGGLIPSGGEEPAPVPRFTGADPAEAGDDVGNRTPGGSGGGGVGGSAASGGADRGSGGFGGGGQRRRGRRGGRGRGGRGRGDHDRGGRGGGRYGRGGGGGGRNRTRLPRSYNSQMGAGSLEADRVGLSEERGGREALDYDTGRRSRNPRGRRPEFRENRGRDRRIRSKMSARSRQPQGRIQDLLQEGQEVVVQVAKDPIAAKGARLTCHVSLAGRHLVCMPTINHIGVSRRIERDDERRKLRDFVTRSRPGKLGFIVRTATAGQNFEDPLKNDMEYLEKLWGEICEKGSQAAAPTILHEDLNPVLRAVRDWVSEDVDKILVDSKFYYQEMKEFVHHFMPHIEDRVELYQGDIPIFDAYGISAELHRALERKVWLKSGGYIVVDQAEALVAIDVNTGRFVGKKNLEDTIVKTNLEAVEEIAYQLRIRNCGGIIILDLIDMEKEENRRRVLRALEAALRKDRARPTIVKISDLGLIEMTRKRTRDTLVRVLCQSCSHCEGKGFVKNRSTVSYEILREIEREGIERDIKKILVQAHPDVIDVLAIDEKETLDNLERRFNKTIFLQAVTDYHVEQFEVSGEQAQARDRDRGSAGRSDPRRSRGGRDRGRDRDRGGRGRSRRPEKAAAPAEEVPLPGPAEAVPEEAQKEAPPIEAAAAADPIVPEPKLDHLSPEEEEDRRAYLRAQAAQDAALSTAKANKEASGSSSNYRRGGGRSAKGRGGGRGGRGGGGSRGGRGSGGSRGGGSRGGRGGRGGGGKRRAADLDGATTIHTLDPGAGMPPGNF